MNQDVADLITAALPVRLTAQQALLFLILWEAKGRVLTYDHVQNRMFDATAERKTRGALVTTAKRLRRNIEELGWPVRIVAHNDVGYRMEVEEGWSI